jgi:hypothetical protein
MTRKIFGIDRRRPPAVDIGIVILAIFIMLFVFYYIFTKFGHSPKGMCTNNANKGDCPNRLPHLGLMKCFLGQILA